MKAWCGRRERVPRYSRASPQPRTGLWHPGGHKRGRGGCKWAAQRRGAVDLLGAGTIGCQVPCRCGRVMSVRGRVAVVGGEGRGGGA